MTAFRPGLWTGMFFHHQLSFEKTPELLKDSGFLCAELCDCYWRQIVEYAKRIRHVLYYDRPVCGADCTYTDHTRFNHSERITRK